MKKKDKEKRLKLSKALFCCYKKIWSSINNSKIDFHQKKKIHRIQNALSVIFITLCNFRPVSPFLHNLSVQISFQHENPFGNKYFFLFHK